jgi:predicted alpha/beta superfamily hydrolase
VVKIPNFAGRLSPRPLYIYTPRGYAEHPDRIYPVLYMHDGQNVFETFAADSYVGSWKADETADRLIGQGRMQECLIVGVSHGDATRCSEYTPPYITRPVELLIDVPAKLPGGARRRVRTTPTQLQAGQADRTFAYYRDDVAAYIRAHYRALTRREHTAVCGSSMGGIFSLYIAWEHPEFARHCAALSPAFAVTSDARSGEGVLERLQTGPRRDVRIWLDSGTQDSPGAGDDDHAETRAARDGLLALGFTAGKDLQYVLDEGAIHHESAWADRLPGVFSFLFPPNEN